MGSFEYEKGRAGSLGFPPGDLCLHEEMKMVFQGKANPWSRALNGVRGDYDVSVVLTLEHFSFDSKWFVS